MKVFEYQGIVILAIMSLCSAAHGAEPKLLPRELLAEGWIQLFDGETLFGWRPVGEARWQVEDGEIRTDGAKPGFLVSTTEWGDYELSLKFRAPEKTK